MSDLRRHAAPPDELGLDFANTRYWRGRATPEETLAGPEDLRAWWAGRAGPDGLPAAGPDPVVFTQLRALREALYQLFAAVAEGRPGEAADLAHVNAALAGVPARQVLASAGRGFAWALPPTDDWRAALAPVWWSAADLLAGRHRGRVRLCANPECRWVFLDTSRAGSRRWCAMSACGNREKARRHYRREKTRLS